MGLEEVAWRLGIDDTDTPIPQDYESIEELIAAHLVDTDVAVIIGFSMEKMRYLTAYSVAVNARGETREISTDDIYELAGQIATEGTPVTHASY